MCPHCEPKLLSLQLSLLTEKYTWAEVLDRLAGLAFEDHYPVETWLHLSRLLDQAAEQALTIAAVKPLPEVSPLSIAIPLGIPTPKFHLFQRVRVQGARPFPATLCGMTWNSEETLWMYAIADGTRVVTEDCLVAG